MPWVQQYAPVGGVVASACLAAIPLIILFYMLAVRKPRAMSRLRLASSAR